MILLEKSVAEKCVGSIEREYAIASAGDLANVAPREYVPLSHANVVFDRVHCERVVHILHVSHHEYVRVHVEATEFEDEQESHEIGEMNGCGLEA